jgi:hypothetical protein
MGRSPVIEANLHLVIVLDVRDDYASDVSTDRREFDVVGHGCDFGQAHGLRHVVDADEYPKGLTPDNFTGNQSANWECYNRGVPHQAASFPQALTTLGP